MIRILLPSRYCAAMCRVETVAAATWCIAGEAAFPTGGE